MLRQIRKDEAIVREWGVEALPVHGWPVAFVGPVDSIPLLRNEPVEVTPLPAWLIVERDGDWEERVRENF